MNISLVGMENMGFFTAAVCGLSFEESKVDEFVRDMQAAYSTFPETHRWDLEKAFYELFVDGSEARMMGLFLKELIDAQGGIDCGPENGGFDGNPVVVLAWMSKRGVRLELIAAFCDILKANGGAQ